MLRKRPPATLLFVLLLLPGLSGCLTAVRSPVLPPPIRLAAPNGFTLYRANPSTSGLVAYCTVRQVDASVLAIRGDTVLLTDVREVAGTLGNSGCTGADSLQLVVSLDPQVQAEEVLIDRKRTRILTLVMLPVATLVGLGAVIILLLSSYTT